MFDKTNNLRLLIFTFGYCNLAYDFFYFFLSTTNSVSPPPLSFITINRYFFRVTPLRRLHTLRRSNNIIIYCIRLNYLLFIQQCFTYKNPGHVSKILLYSDERYYHVRATRVICLD